MQLCNLCRGPGTAWVPNAARTRTRALRPLHRRLSHSWARASRRYRPQCFSPTVTCAMPGGWCTAGPWARAVATPARGRCTAFLPRPDHGAPSWAPPPRQRRTLWSSCKGERPSKAVQRRDAYPSDPAPAPQVGRRARASSAAAAGGACAHCHGVCGRRRRLHVHRGSGVVRGGAAARGAQARGLAQVGRRQRVPAAGRQCGDGLWGRRGIGGIGPTAMATAAHARATQRLQWSPRLTTLGRPASAALPNRRYGSKKSDRPSIPAAPRPRAWGKRRGMRPRRAL